MLNTTTNRLLWKVCGMRDLTNIEEVLLLEPDFMGFIFYPKSPRYVVEHLKPEMLLNFPTRTKKVGVFVNQDRTYVGHIAKEYTLDYLQLHGSETPQECEILNKEGFKIIKAFSIGQSFDFESIREYLPVVDYFLFDTKAEGAYGGHGKAFDWEILLNYPFKKPFLLAGGLDLNNIHNLDKLKALPLLGIDVNSKFELDKAMKDVPKLKKLKKHLNQIDYNVF
jgi:phosphoribosylanthranilate isomerase